jgi:hypothetical protein
MGTRSFVQTVMYRGGGEGFDSHRPWWGDFLRGKKISLLSVKIVMPGNRHSAALVAGSWRGGLRPPVWPDILDELSYFIKKGARYGPDNLGEIFLEGRATTARMAGRP